MKQQNKTMWTLLAIMVTVALFSLSMSIVKEAYLGYVLMRSQSLNEVLFFINNASVLGDVYLVSLVKSMSDVSITFIKFIQALEFKHIVAPVLLLLAYDVNRVHFQNLNIKVGIIMYALAIIIKYLFVLIIGLFMTPSVMNPTILFEAIGFILILQQIFVAVSIILIFVGVITLSRKEAVSC